ncbi:MAG TPA: TetR family transcriptional regulator C-terminal domain-containing protein [Stellaceae bacterium]
MRKVTAQRQPSMPADQATSTAILDLPRFADRGGGRESDILVAAFHCIAEIGIAATTTRAVAARADISQGAIHYYFDSKDALLLGVLKGLLNNSIANMRLIRDSDLGPRQKLDRVLNLSTSFVREKEEVIVRVALWAHCISKGGIWRENYRALFDDFRAVVIEIIEDGKAKGEFKTDDSASAAEIIISSVFGIGMQHTMNPGNFALSNIGGQLTDFYLRILGVEGEPTRRPKQPTRKAR